MDYSYSFQDNISSSFFDSTSKNVLNWIEENHDAFDWAKDPNAYEMANIFLFGAKYSHEGKTVDVDTLTRIWDIRSKDFERCNINQNNFVYKICQDAYQSALVGKSVINDENSHHALRKMAGLGLFLKQQQRDTGHISYNNPQELIQLLQCSKTLRTFHSDLFDRYAFEENINTLCRLQLEQPIPKEVAESITTAQSEVFKTVSMQSQSRDIQSSEKEI